MRKYLKFLKNKYFKLFFWGGIYLFWIIWVGNYWFLIGLPIIFDMYITKKVWWTFWKKKGVEKQPKVLEWVDAIIVAGFAATIIRIFILEAYKIPTSSMESSLLVGDYLFVSKVAYGPRVPETPIAMPFVHHTLPLTHHTPSFTTWLTNPYHRLVGFDKIKNHDIVVFNFPVGDTVCTNYQEVSYYELCRQYGRETVWENQIVNPMTGSKLFGDILVRPVDKQENYVKRCIGIAGDTLQVINAQVYINGKPEVNPKDRQLKYFVKTNGTPINPKILQKYNITEGGQIADNFSDYWFFLTKKNAERLKAFANVIDIQPIVANKDIWNTRIFPHDSLYQWNEDFFGPLYIPKKGATIKLTMENLPLYERAIDVYEDNDLEVKTGVIYINGKPAQSYTFKMDYFFMMGDNRHNSADSRFWGFVPEDHVVGQVKLIWFSTDKNGDLFHSIRWNRLFTYFD